MERSPVVAPPRRAGAAAAPPHASIFLRGRPSRMDQERNRSAPPAAGETDPRPRSQIGMTIPRHVTMGVPWIKVCVGLRQRREVRQMARELDLGPDAVVGKLIAVWGWFDGETADGKLPGVSLEDVDAVAECPKFGAAMVHCGWLTETCGQTCGLAVDNFERHMGRGGKRRALEALRKATKRNGSD